MAKKEEKVTKKKSLTFEDVVEMVKKAKNSVDLRKNIESCNGVIDKKDVVLQMFDMHHYIPSLGRVVFDDNYGLWNNLPYLYEFIDKKLLNDKDVLLMGFKDCVIHGCLWDDMDDFSDKDFILKLIDICVDEYKEDRSGTPIGNWHAHGESLSACPLDPTFLLDRATDDALSDKDFMLAAVSKIGFWSGLKPEESAGEDLQKDEDYQERLKVLIEEREKAYKKYTEKDAEIEQ